MHDLIETLGDPKMMYVALLGALASLCAAIGTVITAIQTRNIAKEVSNRELLPLLTFSTEDHLTLFANDELSRLRLDIKNLGRGVAKNLHFFICDRQIDRLDYVAVSQDRRIEFDSQLNWEVILMMKARVPELSLRIQYEDLNGKKYQTSGVLQLQTNDRVSIYYLKEKSLNFFEDNYV